MCMAHGCQKNLRLYGEELQVVANFSEPLVCVYMEWRLCSTVGVESRGHLPGVDFIAPPIELVGFGANFCLTTSVILLS